MRGSRMFCQGILNFLMVIRAIRTSANPEEGGRGSGPPSPLKNYKNIGFLSDTGPDPLKNHKATKPAFNVGPS